MILHPLRSEFNFPILEKFDADLKPERWLMPMHLLEAVFYSVPNASVRSLSVDDGWKYRKAHTTSRAILDALVLNLQRGFKALLVQDTPHLVVLHQVRCTRYNKRHKTRCAMHEIRTVRSPHPAPHHTPYPTPSGLLPSEVVAPLCVVGYAILRGMDAH